MNKLAGKRTGFALGSTIQAQTKGIWMWCVPHPRNTGQKLVLLDTEGLGDVEKGDSKNDAWIFSLAVLLSSALVYNSLGTIDQQSMEQLHYVTELTKRIKLKSSSVLQSETSEYKRFFPSFTWCVRDFGLVLEKDGKPITEDEYLMSALEMKKGTDKKTQDYNLPRECVLHYFHSHKCFVFDRPASGRNLQNLEKLEKSQLEKEFVEQTTKFCHHMTTNSRVKTLDGGRQVTGRMLAVLADSYVKAIQTGSVPCMENAVLVLAEIENKGALEDALTKYQREMDKSIPMFPTETQQQFLNMHTKCEKDAIQVFLGRSLNDKDQTYQQKLKELIHNKMNEYSTKNANASRDFCTKLIQQLSATLERDILAGRYLTSGGYQKFYADIQKIMETYKRKPGKGIMADEVLQTYIHEKEPIAAAIMQGDNTLTEKERQLQVERARAEIAERDRQAMNQKIQNLQQCIEEQRVSFEQQKQMLMNKMREERKKMIEENELVISRKLQEHAVMKNAGFQDKMSALQKEINNLRAENKSLLQMEQEKKIQMQRHVASVEKQKIYAELAGNMSSLQRQIATLQNSNKLLAEKEQDRQMQMKQQEESMARRLQIRCSSPQFFLEVFIKFLELHQGATKTARAPERLVILHKGYYQMFFIIF
ncbi:guanylate-binding protein 2-like [Leptodactylus fuscus]|uniref:guanylate-binding protein 2-like n=1 Tax=Leptodactylus fuscus TaxID=238119 RepID=UPI003F4EF325